MDLSNDTIHGVVCIINSIAVLRYFSNVIAAFLDGVLTLSLVKMNVSKAKSSLKQSNHYIARCMKLNTKVDCDWLNTILCQMFNVILLTGFYTAH